MARFTLSMMVPFTVLAAFGAEIRSQDPPKPATSRPSMPRQCPWDTPEDARTREKLSVRIPSLVYDGASFAKVIDDLRAATKANIKINWPAMEFADIDRGKHVSMSLRDVTLRSALRVVLDHIGGGETELTYDIAEGVIRISTLEDLSRRTFEAVYDCDDLLNVEEKRFTAQVRRVLRAASGASKPDPTRDLKVTERVIRIALKDVRRDLADQLIETIRKATDPESWRETGGNVGSITRFGDRLIIVQTVNNHQQIVELLARLRARYPERRPIGRWP